MPRMGRPPKETWARCKVTDCVKEARGAKGFCHTHYVAARRGRLDWETGVELRPHKRVVSYGPGSRCLVPACGCRPLSNNLCARHHSAWRRGEDVGVTPPEYNREKVEEKYTETSVCLVTHCTNRPVSGWMCSKHAQQREAGIISAHGEPQRALKSAGRKRKEGPILDGAGYALVVPPSGYSGKTRQGRVLEHRLVMERLLGRLLEAHEVVHHKDGNKLNNAPENLELNTRKTHPPAHEYTLETAQTALEALRHNDPAAYAALLAKHR